MTSPTPRLPSCRGLHLDRRLDRTERGDRWVVRTLIDRIEQQFVNGGGPVLAALAVLDKGVLDRRFHGFGPCVGEVDDVSFTCGERLAQESPDSFSECRSGRTNGPLHMGGNASRAWVA
jgi:hypothetical protein